MTKRSPYRLACCLAIGTLFVFSYSDAASWRDQATVYHHPGRAEIVDLGLIDNNPPVRKMKVHTKYFWVFEDVIPPNPHSVHLLQFTDIKRGEDVLDLGTGAGVLAVFAAEFAERVIATDINPKAVENAEYNVKRHGVEHIVTVRQGDLFAPVETELFDVIMVNLDFPYEGGNDPLWNLHRRLFENVSSHLKPHGRLYYQAGEIVNAPIIQQMARDNGLRIDEMHMLAPPRGRQPIVFVIRHESIMPR